MYSKEIKHYAILHYSGRDDRNYKYRSIIRLDDAEGKIIGALYFHRDEETIPDADSMASSGHPLVHYPDCEYDIVLDLLRNENPVYIQFVAGNLNIGSIRTSEEPVGEGEA